MRHPILLTVLFFILLGACASNEPIRPKSNTDWVMLSTYPGPWCGRCDTTTIIVHFDGEVFVEHGHWLLDYRFWQVKRRKATIDGRATSRLLDKLEALRPNGAIDLFEIETCGQYMADAYDQRNDDAEYRFHQSGIKLRWRDKAGEDALDAYFGCLGPESIVLKETIKSALDNTGIAGLEIPEWN